MVVTCSVYIDAPVERVFALMSDPAQRAQLNPDATPLHVALEGSEAMHVGSVCHFRLRIGTQVVEYRSQVREFVPGRRIVTVSDTAIPFTLTIETVSEGRGTRLTQTEELETSDTMLFDTAPPPAAATRLTRLVAWALPFLDADSVQNERQREEQALRLKLEEKLDRWLAAIRRHLETAAGG